MSQTSTSLNLSIADLICPQPHCRHPCTLALGRIICPTCGWRCNLTAEQHAEVSDGLAGIADLNLAAYLQILALDAVPAQANDSSNSRRLILIDFILQSGSRNLMWSFMALDAGPRQASSGVQDWSSPQKKRWKQITTDMRKKRKFEEKE